MDPENEERTTYNCTLAGKNKILEHIELIENMLKCNKCNQLPTENAEVYVKNGTHSFIYFILFSVALSSRSDFMIFAAKKHVF